MKRSTEGDCALFPDRFKPGAGTLLPKCTGKNVDWGQVGGDHLDLVTQRRILYTISAGVKGIHLSVVNF